MHYVKAFLVYLVPYVTIFSACLSSDRLFFSNNQSFHEIVPAH